MQRQGERTIALTSAGRRAALRRGDGRQFPLDPGVGLPDLPGVTFAGGVVLVGIRRIGLRDGSVAIGMAWLSVGWRRDLGRADTMNDLQVSVGALGMLACGVGIFFLTGWLGKHGWVKRRRGKSFRLPALMLQPNISA